MNDNNKNTAALPVVKNRTRVPLSDEARKKISEKSKEMWKNKREQIIEAQNIGKANMTKEQKDEANKKNSLAHMGNQVNKNRPMHPNTVAALKAANLNNNPRKGISLTQDTKNKISESKKAYWAKKKQQELDMQSNNQNAQSIDIDTQAGDLNE